MATRFYGTVLHRISLALGLTAGVLIIAACNIADPFASSSGVNYIASQGFDSGQWKVVYSLPTNVTNGWQYLTFSQVSASKAGTTAGLPNPSAPLYRLEIPNLVPNGDFENTSSTTGQTAGWSLNTATTSSSISWDAAPPAGNAIEGTHSLSFDLTPSGVRADYPLVTTSVNNFADGLVPDASYRFLFDFAVVGSTASFDIDSGGTGATSYISDAWTIATGSKGLTDIFHFPADTSLNPDVTIASSAMASSLYFSIGLANATSPPQQGELDNLRVTRTDIDDYLHLAVPLGDTGRSNLIPGTYEFSVWMKLEDSSQVTPQVPNAYDASGVTLEINSTPAAFSVSQLGLSSTTWKQVSMKAFVQVDTSLNSSATAINLYLSPTNIDAKDVGGILVSSPTLTFLPNG